MHPVYQRQRRELGENNTYRKTASIACLIRVEELSEFQEELSEEKSFVLTQSF